MPKNSKPVIFFGNERLATAVATTAPTLNALIAAGYDVKAVVANYKDVNRSRSSRELEVAVVARAHNIPLLLPKNLREVTGQLAAYRPSLGILVAYGRIVPQSVIDIFPLGIINLHPSLLPLHRGPTPIESAILNGDTKTGVSIMQLVQDMDAGPVYAQAECVLTGDESKQSLADSLLDLGQATLLELLPEILNGSAAALLQDDSRATYDRLIAKDDGLIDWQKPAMQLEREVRAFIEWPKSRATLGGHELIITKAKVIDEKLPPGKLKVGNKKLIVGTTDQSLEILELKPAGKSEMTAQAFLAGYGQRLKSD